MSDLKLDVAYGIGRKQNITHWRNDTVTWHEVVGWADTEQTTEKERAGSYVFGSLVPTPHINHTGTGCPVGCTDLHRNKAAIQERRAFTFDVDNAPLDFADRVKALGVTSLLHTTASSTPEMPRLRLIMPTDRPLTPTEFRQCSDHLMRLLSRDGDPVGMFDPTCDQAERVMYKPTGMSVEKWVTTGALFGVDEILPEAVRLDKGARRDDHEPYDDTSPPRDLVLGVHRLAKEAIDAELARLDDLPYPWVSGQSFWDTTVFEVACALVRHANSGWTGYTLEQAEADLHDHAPTDDVWGSGDNVVKWDRALSTVDGAGVRVRLTPDEEFEFTAPVTRLQVADLADMLRPERPARHWLMEDTVPTGDQASIVAPGGVGKSLWVLGLALAAASGATAFCGKKVDLVGRVFYLDLENSQEDWIERLRAYGWTQESIRQLRGRFVPLILPPLSGLDTKSGADQLKEFLQAWGVRAGDLLVMDSLQRVTEGAENDSDTLRDLYNHTSMWLKGLGVTVIRTDNTGKDEGKGARGTSGKRDDVGYSYTLSAVGSSQFRLTSTKHRSAGGGGVLFFERKTDAHGRLVWQQDFNTVAVDPLQLSDLMETVSVALQGVTGPLSTNLLVNGTTVKGRKGDIRSALNALVADGYVRRDKGPNRTNLHTSVKPYRAADAGLL